MKKYLLSFLSYLSEAAKTICVAKHEHVVFSLQMSHYMISEFQSLKELFGVADVALCYINFKTGL